MATNADTGEQAEPFRLGLSENDKALHEACERLRLAVDNMLETFKREAAVILNKWAEGLEKQNERGSGSQPPSGE